MHKSHSRLAGLLLPLFAPAALALTPGVYLQVTGEHARSSSGGTHENQSYAAVELGLGLEFNDQWAGELVLLAEDIGAVEPDDYQPTPGATDKRPDHVHIDTLTLAYRFDSYQLSAGRYTLPFGDFETAVVTDPQTLEVGETATELGATLAFEGEQWDWQLSAFNGNVRSSAPDESGFSAGLNWHTEDGLRAGAAYLSAQHAGQDAPALWDLYAAYEQPSWLAHAEFTGAASASNGERPRAFSADAAYLISEQWHVGARWQRTWGSAVLDGGNGEYREWALATAYNVNQYLALALEYAHGDEQGAASARQWLAQVTLSFE